MKIVFFGTSEFAKDQLLFLLENKLNVIAVVTQPDKPMGRQQKILPCPVKKACLENNLTIPILQPKKASSEDIVQFLKSLKPDLFIVVAYGQILKQNLLDVPVLDSINVHTSLLPKYRGAAPIQRAIMEGEKETGITIMKMVKKLDAGDILVQKKISIENEPDFASIEKKLSQISGPSLLEVIDQYKKNTVRPIVQDESLATYAHKITPEDRHLDFNQSASVVHNQIRALSPNPGAYVNMRYKEQIKRLKILRSKVCFVESKPYENFSYSLKEWIVGCKDGAIEILMVQLEGKREMDYLSFSKGLHEEPTILPFP